jgi:transcriptional regulator with XRE-family HTH domain
VGEAAGCLLRVIRQARGLSPIQMAELLRLPREYIDNYEQGKSAPRPGTIVRICEKLAIEPAAFIAAVEIAARGSLNTAVEIAARGSVQ